MRIVIWVVLVFMPVVVGMVLSGGLGQFVDPPSAFFVMVPTIGSLLVGFKGRFVSSFTSIWRGTVDNATLNKGVQFWNAAKKYAIGYGCLGFMIGLVAMLSSLDDMSSIGPFMAVSLISVLYGLVVAYIVADPIAGLLESKIKRTRAKG